MTEIKGSVTCTFLSPQLYIELHNGNAAQQKWLEEIAACEALPSWAECDEGCLRPVPGSQAWDRLTVLIRRGPEK